MGAGLRRPRPPMKRPDLIMQHSTLCDHVDLLSRQLKLYARPEDAATHKIVREAQTFVRKSRRAK